MPRVRKNAKTPQPGSLSDYQQSMREFREVLARAGHAVAHRLKNPRFIEASRDHKPHRNKG